ncbi:3-phosphoshikimate 1-carboxyvinyltransferase [uncultured Eubacterium sp.]|uniref:3-phosphoshikimate 1-carboxyvinyltransferase n=1 Tax=uncultured Eubacterium sp. TaxID=165185 RepID=UPI0026738946|nr:3-phosphoshikimate 1-carboxyvinyltransferase [uncultured Eubacterium sp.]
MDKYFVKKVTKKNNISVEVPGSKSITNRALMLAAISDGLCELRGVLFSDDSRAFLDCLIKLGFEVGIDEGKRVVTIKGENGNIPNNSAAIHVRSAGTAARFMTVLLSVCGGDYVLDSSEQMKKRPMQELIDSLRHKGVVINCLEKEGHFPFEIHSKGINKTDIIIDTTTSSQYASALLMASAIHGMNVKLTGKRVCGAYIKITLRMLEQFGIQYKKVENTYYIEKQDFHIKKYDIEPDMSAACYFYAMAILLRVKSVVRGLHLNSMQGDIKFLDVLQKMGCVINDLPQGIEVNAVDVKEYNGLEIDMSDFSDQALTMAVVAAFAKTPTTIQNVGHIRGQESDRVQVIVKELRRLGCNAEILEADGRTDIVIVPEKMHGGEVETYEDHRVAMSFAMAGLLVDGVIIKNPMCCRKTFENYFDVLESIC